MCSRARIAAPRRTGTPGEAAQSSSVKPILMVTCQWATFLRNHDELTLEMVTEEERQFMWEFYAPEPRMRLNLGIRRRLAPLLENDRDRIELANSLLFTLPGAPVVYYGDEIGMGDDIWLDDRDGVRTPMQWSARANAGFSEAHAEALYCQPIDDEVYGLPPTSRGWKLKTWRR
jgi:maltose alpha-D-glucosyltransferase/alpha-amylase